MTEKEKNQRRNRFYFYLLTLILFIALSYYSGYRLGRTAERVQCAETNINYVPVAKLLMQN
jgi:hypothetical protein